MARHHLRGQRFPTGVTGLLVCMLWVHGCLLREHGGTPQTIAHLLQRLGSGGLPAAPGERVWYPAELRRFYAGRSFGALWVGRTGLEARGAALLQALDAAPADGLAPQRYHAAALHDLVTQAAQRQPGAPSQALAQLDILLTDSFARFAADLAAGVLDPEQAGLAYHVERDSATVPRWLQELGRGAEPVALLAQLRPHAAVYGRLQDALGRYEHIASQGGWPHLTPGPPLRQGDRDRRVAELRQRLAAGVDVTEQELAQRGASDSLLFDPGLSQSLEHFQGRHDLDIDGVLTRAAQAVLDMPAEHWVRLLRINLDRWRWLPARLGERYILVNVPAFRLQVMQGDSTVLEMRTVVGQRPVTPEEQRRAAARGERVEDHQTPLLRGELTQVVFNPYWNVPTGIAAAEILPAVRADHGYLAKHGYEVVTSFADTAQPVQPDTAFWRAVSEDGLRQARGDTLRAQTFPYLLRQQPGPGNALGQLKFLLPNPYAIYLHDTPAGGLFGERVRTFSHGCVRVERPYELAAYLLRGLPEWTPERMAEALRGEPGAGPPRYEQTVVDLPRKVPVYILYFTAWADGDGRVCFLRDVYGRDQPLEEPPERVPVSRTDIAAPASPCVRVGDEVIGFPVAAIFVMPGETRQIEVLGHQSPGTCELRAAGGRVEVLAPGRWSWQAPQDKGLYPLTLADGLADSVVTLNAFVLVPRSHMKGEFLNGYRIGSYPAGRPHHADVYDPPPGFVEVTPENQGTWVSPHFQLGQFLCKQAGTYPKYLVLQEPLVAKLEEILGALNGRGYHLQGLHVMSGYRTPFYNRQIGNVALSRHLWGGAADIFADEGPRDGGMDDLNGDGRVTTDDARIIWAVVDSLARTSHGTLAGGLGLYQPNAVRGPFVHVDVRGWPARW